MRALVPEDLQRNGGRHPYLSRAVFAHALRAAAYPNTPVEEVAASRWNDGITEQLVTRAASSPATTTAAGWASPLAQAAVGDFVSGLAPLSAAAKLFAIAPRLSLDGILEINMPRRLGPIDPADLPWIVEGGPIPVTQFDVSGITTLGPTKKIAAIITLTTELTVSGAGEAVTAAMLREDAARKLDASIFSDLTATTARPAGLLDGIAALSASAATDPDDAMAADLSALAGAISAYTSGIAFVGHPAQINAIRLRRGSFPVDIPLWPTTGVSEGVLICLDPSAVVSAFGAEPEISSSRDAMVHMEADAPLQIASGAQGSGVLATPSRSLWQTDCVGTRLILRCAWALRSPGSVSWIENTSW